MTKSALIFFTANKFRCCFERAKCNANIFQSIALKYIGIAFSPLKAAAKFSLQ